MGVVVFPEREIAMSNSTTGLEVFTEEYWQDWGQSVINFLIRACIALVIAIIAWIIISIICWIVRKILDNPKKPMEPTLLNFLISIIKVSLWLVVLPIILGQLGLDGNSIIAFGALIGVTIGLALQGTVSNLAAGFVIVLSRPFKVGDLVEADGELGVVKKVSIFSTVLKTLSGRYVWLPNGNITSNTIRNHLKNRIGRLELEFGVSYATDVEKARRALIKAALDDRRVLDRPSPDVVLTSLGDSSQNMQLRVWCDMRDALGLEVQLLEAGKTALDDAGCDIPFPQRDVYMVNRRDNAPSARERLETDPIPPARDNDKRSKKDKKALDSADSAYEYDYDSYDEGKGGKKK